MIKLVIGVVAFCCASSSVSAFDDPISVLGRIRWNYTAYEENLWTRLFKNTTLEQIYLDHTVFINAINKAYTLNDRFYPTINASANHSTLKEIPLIDSAVINPYNVPLVHDVIWSNAHVDDYWAKFANWSSFNATNMLDVLTDDAIPVLQTSLATIWNSSNTIVYFNFLKNVSDL